MHPERWQRIRTVFEAALERPTSERAAFLDTACGEDADLRNRVEALLDADATGDPFFDTSLDHLAAELLNVPVQEPDHIGPYRLLRMLGRGGMGQVYLARRGDGSPTQEVALKVIRRGMDSDDILRRFRAEQHILAELDHPNIARLYEAGVTDTGRPYFAMEYLQGLPITTYCDMHQQSLGERLRLFCEVCAAVQHAHEHQVIHRDLKPSNIIVTGSGTVKLLDFGIAKVLSPDRLDVSLARTQTGLRVMTLEYASPEQIRGEAVGPASDIYSLGVLLYEMLTGHHPYRATSDAVHELERLICEDPPERPSTAIQRITQIRHADGTTTTLTPEIVSEARALSISALHQRLRGTLDTLVLKALHKDPEHRYGSSAALAEAVHQYLEQQPVRAPGFSLLPLRWRFARSPQKRRIRAFSIAGILIGMLGLVIYGMTSSRVFDPTVEEPTAPRMLAVLPFEYRGAEGQDYFADGMTDAITAYLADLPDLNIIARSSAFQYKNSDKTAQKIGEELGADYILDGTIQFEQPDDPTGRIRVIPQLIRVSNNTSLWSEAYEQEMADVFEVQSSIAEHVAEALELTLLEPQRAALASRPTQNLEAYTYYLRGNEFGQYEEDEERLRLAVAMYEQALVRDSTFAHAYAHLAEVHTRLWFYQFDPTDERLARGKWAAEKALINNPDIAESYYALGYYYYYGKSDFPQALQYFDRALDLQPNDPEMLAAKAYVLRRQGKLREALAFFEQLERLDPLQASYILSTAFTQQLLRDFPAAQHSYARAFEQAPDTPLLHIFRVWMRLCWTGSIAEARQILEQGEGRVRDDDLSRYTAVYLDLLAGAYQQALDQLTVMKQEVIATQNLYIPTAHLRALAYRGLGDRETARAYEEEARRFLEAYLKTEAGDHRAYGMLGRVYAYLGREEEAIRAGQRGIALMPIRADALKGPFRVEDLATIYTLVGRYDEAIDQLEVLLSHPGLITAAWLRADTVWAPLQAHPRFQRLLGSSD